jgi:hypothetical protein
MQLQNRRKIWVVSAVAAPVLLFAALAAAQTRHSAPTKPAQPTAQVASVPVPTEKDLAATQRQLIELLRLSPTLTTVVAHDPSLLADHDYVNRNNPQLAEFLATHPEVVRNPDFYLYTHMKQEDGSPDQALERAVWPELVQPRSVETIWDSDFAKSSFLLLGFACFLGALIWLIRVFLENRRWSRVFKLQSEVHGKLIDKFGSSQELAAYMETEAGKRFLEAAPISVGFEPQQRIPNAIARVFTPLQIGIVLVLAGLGFFGIHHALSSSNNHEYDSLQLLLMVLNYLTMMTGLGFILSAGVSWFLAKRLGLIPDESKTASEASAQTKAAVLFDPQERQ